MGKQLLQFETVSKGNIGRTLTSAASGAALGFVQKTVQEQGTAVGGISLGTAMPAIEIIAGVGLQFQKNAMLRSIGQAAVLIGSYEAGKQGVGAIIDGIKPSGSVNARRLNRGVPRGSVSMSQVRPQGYSVHSLYS